MSGPANGIEVRRGRLTAVAAWTLTGCLSLSCAPRAAQDREGAAPEARAQKGDGGGGAQSAPAPLDAGAIGRAVGAEPDARPDGVVRATWPRDEVAVEVDGVALAPPAGLTSWAAFSPAPGGAMVMGDTVVFQDEVDPAMDAAFAHGLEVTALHNHFFYDEPKVYFLHLAGHGAAEELAGGVRAVWDAIRAVRRERREPATGFPGEAPPAEGSLDAAALGRIVRADPSVGAGVVKVSIGRESTVDGASFGGSMGLTTWAAFTGTDARAAMDGDFAMTAREVQPVLRALRAAGVHVVALHNHMVGEEPAYYFTHFWAKGSASDLARAFRSALDAQREAGGEDRARVSPPPGSGP